MYRWSFKHAFLDSQCHFESIAPIFRPHILQVLYKALKVFPPAPSPKAWEGWLERTTTSMESYIREYKAEIDAAV